LLLEAIPSEIVVYILCFLGNPKDLANVELVCKMLKEATREPVVWRELFRSHVRHLHWLQDHSEDTGVNKSLTSSGEKIVGSTDDDDVLKWRTLPPHIPSWKNAYQLHLKMESFRCTFCGKKRNWAGRADWSVISSVVIAKMPNKTEKMIPASKLLFFAGPMHKSDMACLRLCSSTHL